MYVLFTDETNKEPSPTVKFFAYGGLFLAANEVPALNTAVGKIREAAGYPPEVELKFDTRSRPHYIDKESFMKAKGEVIDAAVDAKCKFIANVVLHEIAKKNTKDQLVEWGANTVIGAFHQFLEEEVTHGLVFIDRLAERNEYAYLVEKFSKGLLQNGKLIRRLERIPVFSSTCSNASHLSSVVDIVLGAFRYCINQPENERVTRPMMAKLGKLLRRDTRGRIRDVGVIPRPKKILGLAFAKEYDDLFAMLEARAVASA